MDEKNSNNHKIREEMFKFNDNFSKCQSGLTTTNRVNTELTSQIATMEGQCWENLQYSSEETVWK